MIIYVDLLSDTEVCSDSYPTEMLADGGVFAFQRKKVTEGALEVNTGANASAEDGAEELDDNAVTYINIVKAHSLQSLELSKKEYKSMMKSYWKKLNKKLNKQVYAMAGFSSDYVPPEDKSEAKAELEEKVAELGKYDRPSYDQAVEAVKAFKSSFKALQEFVKTTVCKNFDEYEFYMPENAELGECLIVPARWIGDAASPKKKKI